MLVAKAQNLRGLRLKAATSVIAAFWFVCGCGEGVESVSTTNAGALPSGVVARVSGESVSVATVTRIAAAQQLAPRAALQPALFDTLFALAARDTVPPTTGIVIERSACARALLEAMGRDAAQAGPATVAELDEIVRERWADLARPVSVRTTHAVVRTDKGGTDSAARALAEKIASAVSSATSGEELVRLARAVPPDGLQVVAEALPFVTADGRVLAAVDNGFRGGASTFDLDFARAAHAIAEPGQQSPVVKSAFGYHVIRLEERLPEARFSEAELRQRLQAEVITRRARRAKRELIDRLRRDNPVQVERAFEDLTARVDVAP